MSKLLLCNVDFWDFKITGASKALRQTEAHV